jgi:uncharacterized protein YwqG
MTNIIRTLFGRKRKVSPSARDIQPLISGIGHDALHLIKSSAPSRSYLGGDPQLPGDIAWPQRNGQPLGFLARISLSDLQALLPTLWLPGEGALLFFYDDKEQPWGFDPKDRGGWAVIHVPDVDPVEVHRFQRREGLLPHQPVNLNRISVLPSSERPEVEALRLSDSEFDLFYAEAEERFRNQPKHQLLGVPSPIQGDSMELECQLASNGIYCGNAEGYASQAAKDLEAGASRWKLLLQIDSDDDLAVMWGDVGILYYWVEEAAAREGRFENSWLVLQCT